jgi:ABC-type transport system involved in cytochrome c biogenesis permease subunit
LVGATITAVVILGAHAEEGLQGEPPFSYDMLWEICRWTIWGSTLGLIGYACLHRWETLLGRVAIWLAAVLMLVWSLWLAFFPEAARIPDPGLRIVWQMSKSLIAGGILLVGLNLLFGRRGGNVLIHLSIGLLMLGQFIFGDRQIEERITLSDGETTNMALRLDEVELVLIDKSQPDRDRVIAIDEDAIRRAARSGKPIRDPQIPFEIAVKNFYENSDLVRWQSDQQQPANPATVGLGRQFLAEPRVKTGGAKEGINMPSAYVELFPSGKNQSLGVYMVSSLLGDRSSDIVGEAGNSYHLALRLRRSYKDYDITLKDVERLDYAGTSTVRDFSSYVRIAQRDGSGSQDGRIWMNNPMRYRGETLYQSNFSPAAESGNGKDTTGLQVVKNAGWLMPYIACAFACLGMLSHFGITFVRFASRFDRERRLGPTSVNTPATLSPTKPLRSAAPTSTAAASGHLYAEAASARTGIGGWLLPLLTVIAVGGLFARYAMPPTPTATEYNWYAAGSLPMQHEGRIKPFDTVARNVLQALSGRSSTVVRAAEGSGEKDQAYTATQWLYGMIAGQEWVYDAKIFRIDAKEVLDVLDLDTRDSGGTLGTREKLFGQRSRNCYSWNQLKPSFEAFLDKLKPIRDRARENPDSLKFVDQKFLELNQKVNLFHLVQMSYAASEIPIPPEDTADEKQRQAFMQRLMMELQAVQELESGNPPGMIPPSATDGAGQAKAKDPLVWRPLRSVLFANYSSRLLGIGEPQQTELLFALLDIKEGLQQESPAAFNAAVEKYQQGIASAVPASAVSKAGFEAWYNKFGAFNGCVAMYLLAAVLLFASMTVYAQPLRRIAFWMVAVVAVVHLFAVFARVYITDRPPVINLYSSAVYIGCGAVLFGLAVELLFPIRIGLLVGALIGATTLLVANGLETSDTMPMLQAVLDTQFWLTTHVQAITAGYFATFVAGGLAIGAIIHRMVHRRTLASGDATTDAWEIQRILFRVTYGALCFAIFFSLLGTVLGGLWADDSWGRFWGWDPKENGALMIVLWNAIVLHARWDKLVRERGFALLCIAGNIITAWSWFGTNQLGIGLHSYGFTSSVLTILTLFVLSQLLLIAIGWFFTRNSHPRLEGRTTEGSWEA